MELIPDVLLEQWGEYYNSEFVKKNQPWVRQLTFERFVRQQMLRIAIVQRIFG